VRKGKRERKECLILRTFTRDAVNYTANELFPAGSNHLYVFVNPLKASSDLPDDITWEFAQKEIAQAKGFVTAGAAGLSIGE